MAGFEKSFAMAVPEQMPTVIASRNLAHEIFALHDDRELIGFMMASERLMSDEHGEKTREAVRLIVAGGFQMAAKGLRAHVYAKNGLSLRAHGTDRVTVLFPRFFHVFAGGRFCRREVKLQFRQKLF